MSQFSQSRQEILDELQTDPERGLSDAEVDARRAKFGENRMADRKKKSLFIRFIEQFKDVMIVILLIAAVVSFIVACVEGDPMEFIEPALIVFIVVLNAIMGMLQESKAEKALDALKNMSAPHARVLRDGKEKIVQASELVPGDIIHLEAGDFVPADARLLKSVNLKSEESALTGESVPAEKNAEADVADGASVGDRVNMVFSGCPVTYGTAKAVVTATGMQTETGKIAGLLSGEQESRTPLQQKLFDLGKILGIVMLIACAVIFVIGIIAKQDIMEMFMTAVSLAVAAIPEGLPAIVTIVLSLGVTRMVKQNAVIRRLPAVETLGSASVICSDKTGTLTQNRMTLMKLYADGGEVCDCNASYAERETRLLECAALCCDGTVRFEGEKDIRIGDPTETAILMEAHKAGLPQDGLREKYPRLAEIPFDSDRKLMTTVNRMNGKIVVIVKGAFDVLASRCVAGDLERGKTITEQMSASALRVLAVGVKALDDMPEEISPAAIENGLTFLGLVGMIDPPRPEAKDAVAVCRRAGIKPVMITGDHIITASAIARELGILQEGDRAITGAQLDGMTDEELDREVRNISVYARVSPENKIRIVKAWQKKGEVVAMTGDGVNDAPALKAADIGCAMGVTGTDVAKEASDMTLTDDNFATIVSAVKEGRSIYANIKKVVGFLLGTNISEIITVFLAMILWQVSPFNSIQLLWINLITDSLPAVALGMEKTESNIMNRKPKPRGEGLFANGYGLQIILQGCMFSALTIAGFLIGRFMTGNDEGGGTLAFLVLAFGKTLHAYNMRSSRSLFATGFFGNKTLNLVVLASAALIAFLLFVPGVVTVFGMTYLPWQCYLIGLGLCLVPFVVMEIAKAVVRVHRLRKEKNDNDR